MKTYEITATAKLTAAEFEDSGKKNIFIRQTDAKFLFFLNKDALCRSENTEPFYQKKITAGKVLVIFEGKQSAMRLHPIEVMYHFAVPILAVAFDRDLLRITGSFNEELSELTNFELLCRLTEAAGYCEAEWICTGEDRNLSEEGAYTYAYILRRNLQRLHACGRMNDIFQKMSSFAVKEDKFEAFKRQMNKMLSDDAEYVKIKKNTAPFAIIRGNGICAGVLQSFAEGLAEGLAKLGQAVELWSSESVDIGKIEDVYKGIVGFQASIMRRGFINRIKGKKFQFWLDYPAAFEEMFENFSEDYCVLCQDAHYAEFIRKYFGVSNALQLPPAGTDVGYSACDERPYDIVFIGSCFPEQEYYEEELAQDFYEYMLTHPRQTFDGGLRSLLEEQGIYLENKEFLQLLVSFRDVYRSVIGHFRRRVIDTILEAGYSLHVYGDSWMNYNTECRGQLIIHPEITAEDSLKEWGKAKIGLNIMSWHKAGMTERVANILLSGAVCVSEETTYIAEHFLQDEIVTFSLDRLEELPTKIDMILRNDSLRKQIAKAAHRRASREHTWYVRAGQLLELAEKGRTE